MRGKFIVLLLALFSVLPGAGAAAATAPAPVKVYCHDAAWAHPDFKPGGCLFGMSGAPVMTGLRWASWTGTSARATGTLIVYNRCRPPGACGSTRHALAVNLSVVKRHGTVRYFYQMTVRVRRGKTTVVQTGTYGVLCSSCTFPVWRFPARWPFL